jgi:anti-anti-sigma regulatory factor
MNITISKNEKPVPVTILHLEGKLDGANFENLIEEAQQIYADGARDLVLDLSKLSFISSAGLAAIHQVALLFRGEALPGQDQGWAAFHAIDRDRGGATQQHVKLFSPSEPVRQVLDLTGFGTLFESYTDLQQALASFAKTEPTLAERLV